MEGYTDGRMKGLMTHGSTVVSTAASQQECTGFKTGFPPGCSDFLPHHKTYMVDTPVCALDHRHRQSTGVGPRVLHCDCPLLLVLQLVMGQMQRSHLVVLYLNMCNDE